MLRNSRQATRPRILVVGAFPPPGREIFGGIVTSCKILLESSLSERAELTLIDSTQVSHPPPPLALRSLLAARRFFVYLVRFERQRPSAVLLFTAVGASVVEKGAMAWYARSRGVPVCMFPRGGPLLAASDGSLFTRCWVRLAMRGAQTILCQGPAWQKFAVDFLGFEVDAAPIVPNWTATPALLKIGRNRRFTNGDRPVRVVFLGWLDREKGVLELIEACRQLTASHRFHLNLVGEGNASSAVRDAVAKHRLDSVVQISGWLTGKAVDDALAEADVFVLPSWSEGFPNAMIEAMAAKLAIVVTAVGNIPDLISSGREALLVPPRDIPALRSALARVIEDSALRRRLGDAAFVLAEREFGVEQAANRILAAVDRNTSPPDTESVTNRMVS